jgi:hypothetical protein
MSSRRGQRSRFQGEDEDDDTGWGRSSSRRVNGDYSQSSLNASSMTRELDDLMRIIEADWNIVLMNNVPPPQSSFLSLVAAG